MLVQQLDLGCYIVASGSVHFHNSHRLGCRCIRPEFVRLGHARSCCNEVNKSSNDRSARSCLWMFLFLVLCGMRNIMAATPHGFRGGVHEGQSGRCWLFGESLPATGDDTGCCRWPRRRCLVRRRPIDELRFPVPFYVLWSMKNKMSPQGLRKSCVSFFPFSSKTRFRLMYMEKAQFCSRY